MEQYFPAAQSQPVPHAVASPTQLWVQELEDDPSGFLLHSKPVEERSWYGSPVPGGYALVRGGYSPLGKDSSRKKFVAEDRLTAV